ncbi:MAG: lamin tail domain-containing protein [Anaerolineae bacterium]
MSRHWVPLLGAHGALLMALLVVASSGLAAMPSISPSDIVINEIEYDPPGDDNNCEWIELYNNTVAAIDVTGWTIEDNTSSDILPELLLPAGGFAVVAASTKFYDNYPSFDGTVVILDSYLGNGLSNTGDRLYLKDADGFLVDALSYGSDGTVFSCAGFPCAGVSEGHSLERDPQGQDTDSAADFVDRYPPTPGQGTSAPIAGADLSIHKGAPVSIPPGEVITYQVTLSNAGQMPAETVRLTDALPAQVAFLAQTAPFPFSQPVPGLLVWEVGLVPTATATSPLTFTITTQVQATAEGVLTNHITVTSVTTESNPADNHWAATTIIGPPSQKALVILEALYYDGYADDDDDEAVRILNLSLLAVDVSGWQVTDDELRVDVSLPPGTVLEPREALWLARQANAFQQYFGFQPDLEAGDTDPAVPEMEGTWGHFHNDGDQCLLRDTTGQVVDALVYEAGQTGVAGWEGPAAWPWSPSTYFGAEGQILYRKRDEVAGLPVPDSDTAADWAQDPVDQVLGRKVLYPGWDLDTFFWTARITDTAVLTVAVGPDHLFEMVRAQIERAEDSIWIQAYTFESMALAEAILERLAAGVQVRLLLEGSPAGGVASAQQWISSMIDAADGDGEVWFMHSGDARTRYRYQHGKFMLIDGRLALVGSENLNPTGMPSDDKTDGTAGRRGVYLMTDAPGVIARIRDVMAADLDPDHHHDLVTCVDMPALCTPSQPLPGPEPDWISYTVAFSAPLVVESEMAFEVIHSPENSLRTSDSLLGLVGRAGSGDTVLVEQFYERLHWGPEPGTPETDPNLRLQAYLDAARRGACVRILLNSHVFADYESENAGTAAYLHSVARAEGLDLQVRLGNPTFLGLHNKMILVEAKSQGWVHVGSINGSELSSKANREMALQVQSDEAYGYLKAVFDHDWYSIKLPTYMPLVFKGYDPPQPADHLLITEVFYAVSKEEEWVEIANPTGASIDLSAFSIGDAQQPDVFEGMYRFPPSTSLAPQQALVIAASAKAFSTRYGFAPDLEFYATTTSVPTMISAEDWGTGEWELRDAGDQVLLLDGQNRPVDVVVYGDRSYPNVVPHPGVSLSSHSLERYPPFLDTDDCSLDFRDWPFPNPGRLPMGE